MNFPKNTSEINHNNIPRTYDIQYVSGFTVYKLQPTDNPIIIETSPITKKIIDILFLFVYLKNPINVIKTKIIRKATVKATIVVGSLPSVKFGVVTSGLLGSFNFGFVG